jgi:integrase
MEGSMFQVHRHSSGQCEVRLAVGERSVEELSPTERRAFIRLGPSLAAVNAWLITLGADTGYAPGTGYEYAKVLMYALEWLAQEPVSLTTHEPLGHSLLTLSRADLRALFAWLDIPARQKTARARLVKTGELPLGYRAMSLAASTRNVRAAALFTFYDWIIAEYVPADGVRLPLTENPLTHPRRRRSIRQEMARPDGLLPHTPYADGDPQRQFRRHDTSPGPVALSPAELRLVLDAVPAISHGRNAANRNGALVRLLLWGMLRQSEAIAAVWEAVDDRTLWVCGKGNKRRFTPILDPSTWGYLQAYTNELGISLQQRFHGPLFRQLDHEDQPITKHTIEHLIIAFREHFRLAAEHTRQQGDHLRAHSYMILASKLRSHIFRATGATFLAAAGMPVVKLALLLGHADPSTTQQYYLAAEQMALSEAVQQICQNIMETLTSDVTVPSLQTSAPADGLGWYRRHGLLPETGGKR